MKLFSRLSRSASRLGRSKSQAGQEDERDGDRSGSGKGDGQQQQEQQEGAMDASASGATAVTAATDAALAGEEEELPSIAKLEQTMSDLRVKEGEAAAVAAAADDDASIPPAPPGAMGDDSMLRGLSSLDFGAGSSLSFLVGSSIGSEAPLPKDGSAGTAAGLKGASSGDSGGAPPLETTDEGRESEDLGPGVPPLFLSDSSVNVYVPTKLRRAGSHTTGTYADPANNMRQEIYVRRKEQQAQEAQQAGGEAEGEGEGEDEARPISMSTTATGDELINMEQFNSNTSSNRVVSMQYQRAFDSNNTAYQQQQLAIAQGAVSQPGAADLVFRQPSSRPTSLDGRCIDAIMALGSSGDSGGGGGGGGRGGTDSFRLSRDLPHLDSTGGASVMSISSLGGGGGGQSRPTSAVMAPVPLPVPTTTTTASPSDEDIGASVSVAPGVDSPVFLAPSPGGGGGAGGLLLPQPPRASLEGEPVALPHLSGSSYSGKSADWFGPDGPAPLPGGSGATAPSYLNAFRDDSTITGGSSATTMTGGSPAVSAYRNQQQQQQQPPPPLQGPPPVLPFIMDGTQQQQPPQLPPQPPPPGGRVMPVPLPQGYAPPAHYNHQVMPPAPQPYQQLHGGAAPPFMGGGSGPGGPLNGAGGRGGGLVANRSRRASSGGNHARAASGEDDWGDDGTTATTPTGKGDKAKGAGRYKCRYCGGIKRQHVCPALIDIPRASAGTQVDLALTMGQGGMPMIPVELHGCRFLTVRRPYNNGVGGVGGSGDDFGAPAFHQAPSLGGSGASLGSSMGSLSMQIPMVPAVGPIMGGGPVPVVLAAGPPDGVYYQQAPPPQQQPQQPQQPQPQQQQQYYQDQGGAGGPQVVQYPPTDGQGSYVVAAPVPAAPPGGYTDHHAV